MYGKRDADADRLAQDGVGVLSLHYAPRVLVGGGSEGMPVHVDEVLVVLCGGGLCRRQRGGVTDYAEGLLQFADVRPRAGGAVPALLHQKPTVVVAHLRPLRPQTCVPVQLIDWKDSSLQNDL